MPEGTRPAPPDDTVRVAISGTFQSMPWTCVLWLSLTAASRSVTDLAAIITSLEASWNTRFTPRFPATVLKTLVAAVWKTPGGGELVTTNGTSRTGSNGGGTINNVAVAVVLDWHIDQYYRGGKPRTYMPSVITTDATDGVHLTSAAQTSWATAAEGFRSDVNALSSGGITAVKLGTVSFQRAHEWRVPPVFYPYNSVTIRPTMGIQRRRLLP